MIYFRSYLIELFDKKFTVKAFSPEKYTFVVQEKKGRLLPVPTSGVELDKWVEANYVNGIEPTVYTYSVDFTEIGSSWVQGYEEFSLFYGIVSTEDKKKIWELGFDRKLTELRSMPPRPRAIGSGPRTHSRYYWHWFDIGSDEDLNWLNAGEAAAILGTVVEATKMFANNMKPRGIIIGTKSDANPARGRIYKALARKAAAAAGGKVYDLAMARGDMAAPAIVWFDKSHDPFKDMQ